jgi:cyclic beta-1,2-glucan synthetase
MWLMSAVSARDLGYITPDDMVARCTATLNTLEKLERCEGHILNWYNVQTLQPLPPKYVSTVDSGNLIASLWVLAQAIREFEEHPQVEERALAGLADTVAVLAERFPPDHGTAVPLEALRVLVHQESAGIEIIERIRLCAEPARKLTETLRWSVSDSEERAYWFNRLEAQIESWIQYFDRYVRWADVLAAPPDDFLQPLSERARSARRRVQCHSLDRGFGGRV